MKKIGLLIFSFCITFKISAQDSLVYSVVNDLLKNEIAYEDSFYLYENAAKTKLKESESPIREQFIKECRRYITEKELNAMFAIEINEFKWEQEKFSGAIVFSSFQRLKGKPSYKKTRRSIYVSKPVFDSTKKFALVNISRNSIGCGDDCLFLLKLEGDKWTIINPWCDMY